MQLPRTAAACCVEGCSLLLECRQHVLNIANTKTSLSPQGQDFCPPQPWHCGLLVQLQSP